MSPVATMPSTNRNGFTLVEVLVSLLVLGIGLLGLAGMQVAGLRNNQSAMQRTMATQLAYDLTDRMRANQQGLAQYVAGTATTDDCRTNACSPAQMAGFDLKEWNTSITQSLPGGVGLVCRDRTPNDGVPGTSACSGDGENYAIKIWWYDDKTAASPTYLRFATSFQP